ncbi:MAG: ferrochelatase [Rhodospirillaceae bacterium]|nr:ferrochelatase [Rhodospirillaceae bacterium]
MRSEERLAIVVFNLGGPDGPKAVRPFLFNLFNDPYIIPLPTPLRWLFATAISTLRASKSRGYYNRIGGKSVLLPETEAQARALEAAVKSEAGDARVFVFMRYWHPMAREVVAQLKDYNPTRIVLLPLYPQFSITTTGTSLIALEREAKRQQLATPFETLCCFPTADGLIAPIAEKLRAAYEESRRFGTPRVLFSAHGLPEKTIANGDPYEWQVAQSTKAVVDTLDIAGLDWTICYQSRVTPVPWLGPPVEAEIRRAGKDKVPIIIVPISFVSEHVETLVELDETMRVLAVESGVPHFSRLAAVRTDPQFIRALAGLTDFLRGKHTPCSAAGKRICPAQFGNCPHAA